MSSVVVWTVQSPCQAVDGVSVKLAVNIRHVSENCWKGFQGQRSEVKVMYSYVYKCVNGITAEAWYGSFRWRMNAGCAGKTVRSLENPYRMPYLSASEVWSRQGAIQIHVYLYLYISTVWRGGSLVYSRMKKMLLEIGDSDIALLKCALNGIGIWICPSPLRGWY